ncbi:hypothetical protein GCM10020218_106870 [Dactylosporangium vinaceum]
MLDDQLDQPPGRRLGAALNGHPATVARPGPGRSRGPRGAPGSGPDANLVRARTTGEFELVFEYRGGRFGRCLNE